MHTLKDIAAVFTILLMIKKFILDSVPAHIVTDQGYITAVICSAVALAGILIPIIICRRR